MKIRILIFPKEHQQKVRSGLTYYQNNKEIINNIDQRFEIEKELLLALMGIETNLATTWARWILSHLYLP